jgi:leucyl aminopeptidase
MRIRWSDSDLSRLDADLAACFACEGDTEPRGIRDPVLRGALAEQMRADRFKSRPGDRLVWSANGPYAARRFLVIGLGPDDGALAERVRLGCAGAARAAAAFSAERLAVRLPPAGGGATEHARVAAEGVVLGAYQFDRYLTDAARRVTRLRSVEISATGAGSKQAGAVGELCGRAVCLARDLVNEAPSRLSPGLFARRAEAEARRSGLSCRVLGQPGIERLGLGALLAVARGSAEPPRVVHLTYLPRRARAARRILLVGKGVTFDSGGLNLKTAENMLTMKMDMAGAAAVLATMRALPRLGCRAEVHGLLGLVENMTGGTAYKPGDILETHSGKTVEVGNTDAEGRLVLCDLLSYGVTRWKPACVVDVATLTGACVVALGTRASGLFTRDDALRDALLAASQAAGERLWPLPLYEDYLPLLQKGPADLCNVGGRWGGAITAALFLGEFVPRTVPWAHLDIAGPAFSDSELPDAPAGATGAAVLTLLRWLEAA